AGLLEADVRVRDRGVRKARDGKPRFLAVLGNVFHYAEVEGIAEAGADAGRLEADLETVDAHVALADLTLDGVELRRVVGADPGAVAAAEAGFRVLQDGA